MRRSLSCVVAVLALFVGASPASAAIITFNNLAAWQAAATGVNTITFEENGNGGFTFKGTVATFNGINFSIPAGALFTIDPASDPLYSTIGTGDVLTAQQGAAQLTVSPLNATALGFDFVGTLNQVVTITLSTGDVITRNATANTPQFLGVTSDSAITGLTIGFTQTAGGNVFNIDNFATGTRTVPVPEPASLVLLGTGLYGAIHARRRARR